MAELIAVLFIKPALLIALTATLAAAMVRARAAVRHTLWAAALGATLLLPFSSLAGPRLALERPEWLAPSSWFENVASQLFGAAAARGVPATLDGARGRPVTLGKNTDAVLIDAPASPPGRQLMWVLGIVWSTIAVLLLIRRLIAERTALRLVAGSRTATRQVRGAATAAAQRQNVRSDYDVRIAADIDSPAVVGLRRSVILLPGEAELWDNDVLNSVLLHEMTHVARRDCLLNLCADLVVAVFWFNPPVLLAARRMRLESERACDESVLRTGTDPVSYAEVLLRVVSGGRPLAAAVAMARRRDLERRLGALFTQRARGTPLSGVLASAIVAATVAISLPIGGLTLAEARQVTDLQGPALPPEPDTAGDSVTSPESERVPVAKRYDFRRDELLRGPDSLLAMQLIAAAARAPRSDDDLVPARSQWALSNSRSGRIVEPMLVALMDRDWRVQAYAAWTLGIARDPRAVPSLLPLLEHPVWRARAMAAFALRVIGDARAMSAMTRALQDPAWQVRMEAVQFLAATAGAEVEPLLRARLADRHIAVRSAAAQAIPTP